MYTMQSPHCNLKLVNWKSGVPEYHIQDIACHKFCVLNIAYKISPLELIIEHVLPLGHCVCELYSGHNIYVRQYSCTQYSDMQPKGDTVLYGFLKLI